mmetsp:Transcript_62679/g.149525  ORF Transcript_62679/g.149525 Transcript_62679/m.149525 type:complete len:214 (+) Transcript_62679:96-737(+)|eukprot:CAMPEP_0178416610 /NCGR_PEP_ID=MMETSP0689_2-20121128/24152_1 /TAXON_ID=160604 /ORGANISM="Amphidinium massartii, Strain CS-259" /LENGTH=213 /DNA_ID=CAMNT_0020037959 /DNA_START=90 /DNA_END=731 /DNA_ORIENTATION=+
MAPKAKAKAAVDSPAASADDAAAAPAAEGLKKPPNPYFLWLSKNRAAIEEEAGSKAGPAVSKVAGAKWKAMTEAQKKPYDTEAAKLKKEYDAKIAAGAQKAVRSSGKRKAKGEADGEAAPKKAKKPRAPSSYWLWLKDNRERIAKEVGGGKPTLVTKEAGVQWKAVSDAVKAKYQKKAEELKAEMKAKAADGGAAGEAEADDDEEEEDDGEDQ